MEIILRKIVVLLLFASTSYTYNTHRHEVKSNLRILYGDDVPDGQYTYVVILALIRHNHVARKCTATMVSEKFSLTAAHCSDSYANTDEMKDVYIWYKNFTHSPLLTKFVAPIIRIHIHPHYIYSFNNDMIDMNDIALVQSKDVSLKQYARLSAIDFSSLFGLMVTFISGGPTTTEWDYKPDKLRKLQMGLGGVIKCDPMFMEKISYPLICVAPKCDKKTIGWYGDSGAPIINDNKVLGILATITSTDVTAYVPVSPYLDWIHEVVRAKKAPALVPAPVPIRRDTLTTHENKEIQVVF